jgi:hypothetical protein
MWLVKKRSSITEKNIPRCQNALVFCVDLFDESKTAAIPYGTKPYTSTIFCLFAVASYLHVGNNRGLAQRIVQNPNRQLKKAHLISYSDVQKSGLTCRLLRFLDLLFNIMVGIQDVNKTN